MEVEEQTTEDERGRLARVPVINRWNVPLLRWATGLAKARSLEGVEVTDVRQAGARVRLYRPTRLRADERVPGMLWIHGGGLVIGAPGMGDVRCARFAREIGMVVASAAYRLAPRHRAAGRPRRAGAA